jgi:glutamate 5-kinase
MRSKLEAAGLVTRAGGSVIIASGKKDEPLTRILAGEAVGTLFLANGKTETARRRWIGLTARPKGSFVVDNGARRAIENSNTSLLAIGVLEIRGEFDKGDVVAIIDPDGREFARGLTNYAASEAAKIRGLRTEKARDALGTASYTEVVHRDNLVLKR